MSTDQPEPSTSLDFPLRSDPARVTTLNMWQLMSAEEFEKALSDPQYTLNKIIEVCTSNQQVANHIAALQPCSLNHGGSGRRFVGSPQAVDESVSLRAEFVDLVQHFAYFGRCLVRCLTNVDHRSKPISERGLRDALSHNIK